jgi:hypothetical protein
LNVTILGVIAVGDVPVPLMLATVLPVVSEITDTVIVEAA